MHEVGPYALRRHCLSPRGRFAYSGTEPDLGGGLGQAECPGGRVR